jgi:hypothetical protein
MARDVQNLCTLMQIAHAIYGDGQFFTDKKQMKEFGRVYAPCSSGTCYL